MEITIVTKTISFENVKFLNQQMKTMNYVSLANLTTYRFNY